MDVLTRLWILAGDAPPPSGLPNWVALLGPVSALITGAIGWFVLRNRTSAETASLLTTSARQMVERADKERADAEKRERAAEAREKAAVAREREAQERARVAVSREGELEEKLTQLGSEVDQLRAKVRGLIDQVDARDATILHQAETIRVLRGQNGSGR